MVSRPVLATRPATVQEPGAPVTGRARDRRVARTHRALREALIGLMLERGWEGFTIQDVCDRADVGRSTFYLHFADKEDLLVSGFQQLGGALREQLVSPAVPGKPFGFARGLIEHLHDNQRVFRALVAKRTGHLVVLRFRDLLIELVDEELARAGAAGPLRAAAARFIAGGFIDLVTTWFETPRGPPPPEEMERVFLALAAPVVDAAVAGRPPA